MSFFDSLLKYNNKICIIEDNDKFTYKEFINLSDQLASKINKRSLVFLITGNNIESLATYVGLIREKSVVVLLEKNPTFLHALVELLDRFCCPSFFCLHFWLLVSVPAYERFHVDSRLVQMVVRGI